MSDDLARRAVACPGWRWMPGMLTLTFHEDDDRSLPVCHPPWRVTRAGVAGPYADDPTWGALPDLTDPATMGCLLALVREAWGKPVAVWWPKSTETCCVGVGRMPIASGRFWQRRTYAAALVAALEAAEGQEVNDE